MNIKSKLHTNPGNHAIEDKFEKKLESFRYHMTKTIKDECSNISKSYANHAVVQTPECLKKVIKHARERELAEENEKKRRSKNLILYRVSEQIKLV